jgi:aspartate kinase
MKVFKFGGASVKDSAGVKRVASVLGYFSQDDILVVVSAMGKSTNALEKIVGFYIAEDLQSCNESIMQLEKYHFDIIADLNFPSDALIFTEIDQLFSQLKLKLGTKIDGGFNKVYDQIVSFGELLSTKIVSAYLNQNSYNNLWLDARQLIKTDQNYRFARVDWLYTERMLQESVQIGARYLTQGFIASDDMGNTTTLGREGSDYSASIIAYCLDALEVVIWKDVPGVLNGDPKVFTNTILLNQINYREAIELAFYGASVIHPKTIQPLQEKGIPLKVKSFENPEAAGTAISEGLSLEPMAACFIKKDHQLLIKVSTRDLAFIAEDHLSKIYQLFHQFGARVNLSQHSAVSSSFCINYDTINAEPLCRELAKSFDLIKNGGISLFTIRHHNASAREEIKNRGKVLLEQITEGTYQVAIQEA